MIDKKTVDVYSMFNNTLNAVKKEMSHKNMILPFDQPKFSGHARWSKMLKASIERSMMVRVDCIGLLHLSVLICIKLITLFNFV